MKWFRHDTDMHTNPKMRKLIRVHGATGYAFWCFLLEKLYLAEAENFQINANEFWREAIADDLKLGDYRTPIRILDTLSEIGLIDKQLWQEHIVFVPSIVERGDKYIAKRAYEREKKRKQRAKKAQLSPGDKMGTRGQTPQMSPSYTDPYTDLDPETNINSIDPKSVCVVQEVAVAPPPTKKKQSKKISKSTAEEILAIYCKHKPENWALALKCSPKRLSAINQWVRGSASVEDCKRKIIQACEYAQADDFWSGRRATRDGNCYRGSFESLVRSGRLEEWSEIQSQAIAPIRQPSTTQAIAGQVLAALGGEDCDF